MRQRRCYFMKLERIKVPLSEKEAEKILRASAKNRTVKCIKKALPANIEKVTPGIKLLDEMYIESENEIKTINDSLKTNTPAPGYDGFLVNLVDHEITYMSREEIDPQVNTAVVQIDMVGLLDKETYREWGQIFNETLTRTDDIAFLLQDESTDIEQVSKMIEDCILLNEKTEVIMSYIGNYMIPDVIPVAYYEWEILFANGSIILMKEDGNCDTCYRRDTCSRRTR